MSDELKACPFCGEPGSEVRHHMNADCTESLPTGFWGCNRCGLYMDSVEEWNERKQPYEVTIETGTVSASAEPEMGTQVIKNMSATHAERISVTRAQSPAFGTAELLAIAEEMERTAPDMDETGERWAADSTRRWAARIRAACSPEAVAFFEAACADAERMLPEWDGVSEGGLIPFLRAYRALAAQEKGKALMPTKPKAKKKRGGLLWG